jgi:ubiquitin C-terminal hydrolase
VEECLRRATEAVDLEDNDTYKAMQRCYADLPRILFIHVNRTDWMKGMKKIKGHVGFPFRGLDMAGSITARSRAASEGGLQQSYLYDLCSIVVHHGRAMNQGHFTAFAMAHGEWYHFNDHKVTRVPQARVAAQVAYLLVYQLRDRR